MEKLKVAVYGSGAIGTVFGAFVSNTDADVVFVDKDPDIVRALSEKGARVQGAANYSVPATAVSPENMGDGYDVIMLCTKVNDNPTAVPFLAERLKKDGVVVAMQNGIPEPSIAEVIGKERTLGCTIEWGATLVEPGCSEITSDADYLSIHVGKMAGVPSGQAMKVRNLLGGGTKVHYESDLIRARWVKMIVNCSISALGAVIGGTWGDVTGGSYRIRNLCLSLMKECIDVSKAEGMDFTDFYGLTPVEELYCTNWFQRMRVARRLPEIYSHHARIVPVMLHDIREGSRTEVDFINGLVVECGRKHGIPTPVNGQILDIIHKEEEGILSPSPANLKLFV